MLPDSEAMLGLPSTTEEGRRLPKEALYRNLKLTPKQKDAFVHGVERIVAALKLFDAGASVLIPDFINDGIGWLDEQCR